MRQDRHSRYSQSSSVGRRTSYDRRDDSARYDRYDDMHSKSHQRRVHSSHPQRPSLDDSTSSPSHSNESHKPTPIADIKEEKEEIKVLSLDEIKQRKRMEKETPSAAVHQPIETSKEYSLDNMDEMVLYDGEDDDEEEQVELGKQVATLSESIPTAPSNSTEIKEKESSDKVDEETRKEESKDAHEISNRKRPRSPEQVESDTCKQLKTESSADAPPVNSHSVNAVKPDPPVTQEYSTSTPQQVLVQFMMQKDVEKAEQTMDQLQHVSIDEWLVILMMCIQQSQTPLFKKGFSACLKHPKSLSVSIISHVWNAIEHHDDYLIVYAFIESIQELFAQHEQDASAFIDKDTTDLIFAWYQRKRIELPFTFFLTLVQNDQKLLQSHHPHRAKLSNVTRRTLNEVIQSAIKSVKMDVAIELVLAGPELCQSSTLCLMLETLSAIRYPQLDTMLKIYDAAVKSKAFSVTEGPLLYALIHTVLLLDHLRLSDALNIFRDVVDLRIPHWNVPILERLCREASTTGKLRLFLDLFTEFIKIPANTCHTHASCLFIHNLIQQCHQEYSTYIPALVSVLISSNMLLSSTTLSLISQHASSFLSRSHDLNVYSLYKQAQLLNYSLDKNTMSLILILLSRQRRSNDACDIVLECQSRSQLHVIPTALILEFTRRTEYHLVAEALERYGYVTLDLVREEGDYFDYYEKCIRYFIRENKMEPVKALIFGLLHHHDVPASRMTKILLQDMSNHRYPEWETLCTALYLYGCEFDLFGNPAEIEARSMIPLHETKSHFEGQLMAMMYLEYLYYRLLDPEYHLNHRYIKVTYPQFRIVASGRRVDGDNVLKMTREMFYRELEPPVHGPLERAMNDVRYPFLVLTADMLKEWCKEYSKDPNPFKFLHVNMEQSPFNKKTLLVKGKPSAALAQEPSIPKLDRPVLGDRAKDALERYKHYYLYQLIPNDEQAELYSKESVPDISELEKICMRYIKQHPDIIKGE